MAKVKQLLTEVDLLYTDRISVMKLLPQAGTVLEQMMMKHIARSVELTAEETETLTQHVGPGGSLALTPEENVSKSCSFTPKQIVFIGDLLKKMDADGKVTRTDLPLFAAFLPEEFGSNDEPIQMPESTEEN